jgi:hypothetical protein
VGMMVVDKFGAKVGSVVTVVGLVVGGANGRTLVGDSETKAVGLFDKFSGLDVNGAAKVGLREGNGLSGGNPSEAGLKEARNAGAVGTNPGALIVGFKVTPELPGFPAGNRAGKLSVGGDGERMVGLGVAPEPPGFPAGSNAGKVIVGGEGERIVGLFVAPEPPGFPAGNNAGELSLGGAGARVIGCEFLVGGRDGPLPVGVEPGGVRRVGRGVFPLEPGFTAGDEAGLRAVGVDPGVRRVGRGVEPFEDGDEAGDPVGFVRSGDVVRRFGGKVLLFRGTIVGDMVMKGNDVRRMGVGRRNGREVRLAGAVVFIF